MHTEGLCVQRCAEGLAWLLRGGPAAAKAHACSVRLLPLGLGQILSPGCWGGLTWSQDLGAEQGGRVHGDSSHFPHCLRTPPWSSTWGKPRSAPSRLGAYVTVTYTRVPHKGLSPLRLFLLPLPTHEASACNLLCPRGPLFVELLS